jgi:twitching motility protein PilT
MKDGKLDGMQDFDSVIRDLIERGVVSLEDGLAFATNQNNLLLELKGVTGEDYMNSREVNGDPPAAVSEPGSMLSMIE